MRGVLQWVFAALIIVWLVGWFVPASRWSRLSYHERTGRGCVFGIVWMALGLLLFWGFPKVI